MLLSIVNMKLRNEKETLNDFCIIYQVDQKILLQRFEQNNLTYDQIHNQFIQNN